MKKLILLSIIFCSVTINAQFNKSAPWMKGLEKKQVSTNNSKEENNSFTIYEITESFNEYWKNHDPNKKGSGYKPYMRWENKWKELIHTNGKLPTSKELWDSWENKINRIGKTINPVSSWSSIGPFSPGTLSGALPGQGRVNAIAVDPNNANVWYVGAPAGGLWKSIDAGTNWISLFDQFPQIGVSGIAID